MKKLVVCLLLSIPLLAGCVSQGSPQASSGPACPVNADLSNRGDNPDCV